jgi:hypothetical protein
LQPGRIKISGKKRRCAEPDSLRTIWNIVCTNSLEGQAHSPVPKEGGRIRELLVVPPW